MTNVVLDSIKKLLGIHPEDHNFDVDLLIHINTVINILRQIGLEPQNGFVSVDYETLWSDIYDDIDLDMIRSYVYFKVRTMFDPPQSGSTSSAITAAISELEWRIYSELEYPYTKEEK